MKLPLLTLALAVALAGCFAAPTDSTSGPGPEAKNNETKTPETKKPAELHALTVRASDYAFDAPATFKAGRAEVTLVNDGQDLHHIQFYRLAPGKTVEDVASVLKGRFSGVPEWMTHAGGPNVATPGNPTSAVLDLPAGTYVLACVIPAADGVMHAEKGMIREIRAVADPSESGVAPPPVADVTVSLSDFNFTLASPISAGTHTIRYVNTAPHAHEAVLFELFGNATTMDLLQAIENPSGGAPPGRPVGGITSIASGQDAFSTVELTPGRYTFVCFDVDGAPDGAPHFLHGMVREFVVS